MFLLKVIIEILFLKVVLSQGFVITSNTDNLNCKTSRVQCLNKTMYTTCFNIGQWTILSNMKMECPKGFICQDETIVPCILEKHLPTTDFPVTTLTTTTKRIVSRPTGIPNCKSNGYWPALNCNQYYECVQEQFLWIISFKPKLETCEGNYHFDSTLLKCIPAETSDCED